ncbi:beta-lactamase superfamily domain-containing protein [Russula aff. rugulosa BPL654]|nr:beta-lactamase superfamily domain-containing protein [Russula aff. rugulosa BPL654]
MQSQRPPHHANHSRSQFQNQWTLAETTPSTSTTSTYWWPTFSAGLNLSTLSTFLTNPSISLERVRNSEIHPHPPVKVVKPDWGHSPSTSTATSSSQPNLRATWLGHASFLVEFPRTAAGLDEEPPRVLFDPIFSDCVGPLSWLSIRRRLPPPCTLEEIPEFQFVVYSHNHYDHLDLPTLNRIHELRGERVHFIVPLGNKAWFEETGIPASQITELDWWDEFTLTTLPGSDQKLKFICTPAQHRSGRTFMDTCTTLWASWVVQQALPDTNGGDRTSVYFTGDSGYMMTSGPCPIFKEIGSKYGPFDIAMIPIWRGGTLSVIARLGYRLIHSPNSFLTSMHATPAQALQMHVELRARHSLAMHFATFAGSDYEALEPIVELEQAKRAMEMGVVSVGDWWMEGGMGVIDVGETAVVRVGKTPPSPEPSEDHRTIT